MLVLLICLRGLDNRFARSHRLVSGRSVPAATDDEVPEDEYCVDNPSCRLREVREAADSWLLLA